MDKANEKAVTDYYKMINAWFGLQQASWELHGFSASKPYGEHKNSMFSGEWDERFEARLSDMVTRINKFHAEYLKYGKKYYGDQLAT